MQIKATMWGDEKLEKEWQERIHRLVGNKKTDAVKKVIIDGKEVEVKYSTINDYQEYEADAHFLNLDDYKRYLELTTLYRNSSNNQQVALDFLKAEDPKVNVPDADPLINKIIVTFATLVGFALGGFGIYFFIKTSPKKMKKELLNRSNDKKEVEESPIVEVKAETLDDTTDTKEEIETTKEFKLKDNSTK